MPRRWTAIVRLALVVAACAWPCLAARAQGPTVLLPATLYNLGTLLLPRGEAAAASSLLENAVLIRPDHVPTYKHLFPVRSSELYRGVSGQDIVSDALDLDVLSAPLKARK